MALLTSASSEGSAGPVDTRRSCCAAARGLQGYAGGAPRRVAVPAHRAILSFYADMRESLPTVAQAAAKAVVPAGAGPAGVAPPGTAGRHAHAVQLLDVREPSQILQGTDAPGTPRGPGAQGGERRSAAGLRRCTLLLGGDVGDEHRACLAVLCGRENAIALAILIL